MQLVIQAKTTPVVYVMKSTCGPQTSHWTPTGTQQRLAAPSSTLWANMLSKIQVSPRHHHGISELSFHFKQSLTESGALTTASIQTMANRAILTKVNSKVFLMKIFSVYPMYFNPSGLFSEITFHATVQEKCDDVPEKYGLAFEYCTSAPLTTTAPATAAPTTQATPAPVVLDEVCSVIPLTGKILISEISFTFGSSIWTLGVRRRRWCAVQVPSSTRFDQPSRRRNWAS